MDHQTFQSAQFHDGLTKEDVLSQLSRILSSLLFRESPTVSRFLNYVVQEVLSGENRCIKQYTIAVDALGYSKNFDPHTSNSVRVLAGRLRLMLELYYLNEGTHDKIRISIPKRTYIPTFDTIVWPQAETQSVSPAAQTPVSTPNYGLSIAVIPFSVSSVRKDFANDITDSIVIGLSHYHQMQIVGPLEEYKNATINADRIAQKYRVRFVLQGRIKKYGQALRVNAFLTDALTGFKIWTQTHEYSETANLNDIEDDVSRQIVNALASFSSGLISRESLRKRLDDLEIYEAISRHEHFWGNFSLPLLLSAVEALEYAVRVDPVNPIVLAMLSHAYCANYVFDLGLENASLEEAERLAQLAIELDPSNQFAHYAEAMVSFVQHNADRCIAALKRVISLSVFNAHAYNACGFLFCMLGHWEEGMKLWEEAMRLNSLHPSIYSVTPFMYYYHLSNYEQAWIYAQRYNTGIFWDPLSRAAAAGQLGFHAEAKLALGELLNMRPDFPYRARDLMQRTVYREEHVERLLEGLLKAGLELQPC